MSLLDLNLDAVQAREIVPAGEQHLEITNAEFTTSKKGDPMLALRFRVLDLDGRYYDLRHWIVLGSDDPEMDARRKEDVIRFCDAFGIDRNDDSDGSTWIGLDGFCIITHEEDPEYGTQARISKFIPRG